MSTELAISKDLLTEIKSRVRQAQQRAALFANAEMIRLYWDIGNLIADRKEAEGWGAGVIPRLAVALKNEIPEEKGFSERNLGYMIRFALDYAPVPISQQAVAKLGSKDCISEASSNLQRPVAESQVAEFHGSVKAAQPVPVSTVPFTRPLVQRTVAQIPWGHNVVLMQKIKHLPTRLWYARQVVEQGWSRADLTAQIKTRAHERQGTAVTN
jgi:predicted nuclease of restriction endonuclease-like (RecB) superfamily